MQLTDDDSFKCFFGYFSPYHTFLFPPRNAQLLSFFNSGTSLECLGFLPHSDFNAPMIGHFRQTACCEIFHIIALLNQSYLNSSSHQFTENNLLRIGEFEKGKSFSYCFEENFVYKENIRQNYIHSHIMFTYPLRMAFRSPVA